MAYQTFILTGAYPKFNGVPSSGTIEVIPSEAVVLDATGKKILSGRVKVTLEEDGTFDVALPDPNDTSLNPAGFGYTVVAKLHHTHLPAVSFGPEQIVGGAVDMATVTPVDPSTFDPEATYAPSSTVTALDARVTTLEETPGGVTSYLELTDTPTIPATAEDVGALPAAATDTTVAALAQDPASATGAALSATFARYGKASVDAFGGDPTGVEDSTDAFNAALASLPVSEHGHPVGTIEFSAGTYRLGTTGETDNVGPKVLIKGQGWGATVLDYRGAGRAIRAYSNLFYNSSYAVMFENDDMGGGCVELTIDGTNSLAGAVGLRFGDVLGYKQRVEVRHFNKAGSIGVQQVNTITWTEKVEAYSYVWDCATQYQVDADFSDDTTTIGATVTLPAAQVTLAELVEGMPRPVGDTEAPAPHIWVNSQKVTYQGYTVNGDGTVTLTGCAGGTGTLTAGDLVKFGSAGVSHGYNNLYVNLGGGPGDQIGFRVKDGANLYGGQLQLRGNFPETPAGVPNNGISVYLGGSVKTGLRLSGAAQISWQHLDIQLECYGSINGPKTMQIDAGSVLRNCYGIMRWNPGWQPMGLNISDGARVNFFGYIVGDTSLNSDTSVNTGGPKFRAPVMYHEAQGNPSGPIAKFNDGDFVDLTLNGASSGTLALHAAGLPNLAGPQRKTLIVHQQSTGGTYNYALTWPKNASPTTTNPTVKWAGGVAPTMSTGAGATDVYELVTIDGATWYGRVLAQNLS